MKTAPSFPFYPNDFIMGTMFMSAEEVGAYIRLLCFQWEQGSLPDCPSKTSKIAGISEKKLTQVLEKFHRDVNGKLVNRRMEEVRGNREHFLEIQRLNGKRGGRPKKQNETQMKPMGYDSVSNGLTQPEPKKTLPSPYSTPRTPLPSSVNPSPPLASGKDSQSSADPRHSAFVRAYVEAWNNAYGESYTPNGRDFKVLQDFLKINKSPVDELVKKAAWAWGAFQKHGEMADKSIKAASTIRGFCESYNELCVCGKSYRENQQTSKHAAYNPATATAGKTPEQVTQF